MMHIFCCNIIICDAIVVNLSEFNSSDHDVIYFSEFNPSDHDVIYYLNNSPDAHGSGQGLHFCLSKLNHLSKRHHAHSIARLVASLDIDTQHMYVTHICMLQICM